MDPQGDVDVPLPLRPLGEDRSLHALGLTKQVALIVAELEGNAHPPRTVVRETVSSSRRREKVRWSKAQEVGW